MLMQRCWARHVACSDDTRRLLYTDCLVPTQTRTKYAEREILNQLKLSHPHIIRLEEVFVDSQHLVLVLEYADKGDLHAYVRQKRRLNESEARWIFQQLMLAVDFSHRVGIANRDIKLENILLASSKGRRDRPMVKLADWGLSSDERMQSAPTTRVGTLNYIVRVSRNFNFGL
jgi:serine/threonine-protein kinase SRK2